MQFGGIEDGPCQMQANCFTTYAILSNPKNFKKLKNDES